MLLITIFNGQTIIYIDYNFRYKEEQMFTYGSERPDTYKFMYVI